MKIYLKLFLACGISFGVVTGMVFWVLLDGGTGLWMGLGSGVLFGLGMVSTLGSLHYWKTRKSDADDKGSVHQDKMISLDMSFDAAFDKSLEASRQSGFKVHLEDKDQGRIEAKSGMSWQSYGEVIVIQVSDPQTGGVSVQVSSSPKLITSIVDYGKNYQNVDQIIGLLSVTDSVHQIEG